jgi:hypothetical protein
LSLSQIQWTAAPSTTGAHHGTSDYLSGFRTEADREHSGPAAPQQVYVQHRSADHEGWPVPHAHGAIYFQLRYGKQPLELEKGKSTLKASTFDDLVEHLDQIKTIAVAGGMDEALAACASAVRSNFKTAKEKKAGRG